MRGKHRRAGKCLGGDVWLGYLHHHLHLLNPSLTGTYPFHYSDAWIAYRRYGCGRVAADTLDDAHAGGFVGSIERWDEVGEDAVAAETDERDVDVVAAPEDADADVAERHIRSMT